MTNQTLNLDPALHRYLLDVSLRETPLLKRLREETAHLSTARWQIAPEQGQFMALLVQLMGARRIVEVGTFTGYSALCMAQALPADGRLICCDIPCDYNAIAERYWDEAGLAERIEQRLAPALQTLAALENEGLAGCIDLLFIDADKANYLSGLLGARPAPGAPGWTDSVRQHPVERSGTGAEPRECGHSSNSGTQPGAA